MSEITIEFIEHFVEKMAKDIPTTPPLTPDEEAQIAYARKVMEIAMAEYHAQTEACDISSREEYAHKQDEAVHIAHL
ncbi:MAG: hypothetical protein JXR18_04485 [Neptuniibacter sp.]